ncbi:hypothetical protein ACFV3I_13525 [Microbacterium sp. NPDC059771]|uniref:hypothetical protein n=1 Tax=Microbacterium sp. NPDC059771 TaxID=3346941 RepID=UPI00365C5041
MGGTLIHEQQDLAAVFEEVVRRQDALRDAYDRLQRPPAQARSVIAADNQATNPMQLERFISYCIMQAVDLGRSMHSMVRAEDGTLQLPIMALYPLVRAQIESASMAMWVLAPPDRRTRVLRRLQAGHDELIHERALTKSALSGRAVSEVNSLLRQEARRQKRHKAYLRAIATANSIKPDEYENTFPTWETVVREAGQVPKLRDDALVVVWRLASGFTHPSFRRGASVPEFSGLDSDGNVLRGTLSTKTEWMISVVSIAGRATGLALERWRDLKLQVNGERPVPAPVVPKR